LAQKRGYADVSPTYHFLKRLRRTWPNHFGLGQRWSDPETVGSPLFTCRIVEEGMEKKRKRKKRGGS